jgi:hypothetical protein
MKKHSAPKLHNAMWPGLVGKGTDPGQEPPISLERMLELTAAAEVDGQKFDGIDYFLFLPHLPWVRRRLTRGAGVAGHGG